MGRVTAIVVSFVALLAQVLLALAPAFAQGRTAPLVRVELIAERAAAKPGETVTVALKQTITPGWHTYWRNPGDSGEPTVIEWLLPTGVKAGPVEWPLPHAIPIGPLTNYGYENEVILLAGMTLPQTIEGESIKLAAQVRWLVCKDVCVPEEASVELNLPIINSALSPRRSPHAAAIAATRQELPQPAPWPARFGPAGDAHALEAEVPAAESAGFKSAYFFPLAPGQIVHAAPQPSRLRNGTVAVRLERDKEAAEGAALDGVLAIERTAAGGRLERRGYLISAVAGPVAADAPETAAAGGIALGAALLFAFAGGLILNLMPCVFPVLSLKAYSLAQEAAASHGRREGGFAYLAGVLASCAAIAFALVALRAGGTAIGWGMQFQSPGFVLVMAALFMALGLNMSGVFSFGGSLAGMGDSLTRRSGLSGYFFTGVLATAVATPCTAPFMGAAVGYAFAQPAVETFAVLLTLGLGFALPIVLLSLSPALGRLLPRPGPWMELFKQFMAFPLYATAAWLVWVLSVQRGSEGVLAAMVTLIGVAFAAWLLGLPRRGAPARASAALAIALGALAFGWAALPAAPPAGAPAETASAAETSGPPAETFTQARLDGLLAARKPVFVNLTAAWCITCKVNERVALSSETLARAFAERGVTYLKGDWTNGNPEITALLKSFGRVGVPLYLLYTPGTPESPQVLPQILTESIVLGRLAAALPGQPRQAKGG